MSHHVATTNLAGANARNPWEWMQPMPTAALDRKYRAILDAFDGILAADSERVRLADIVTPADIARVCEALGSAGASAEAVEAVRDWGTEQLHDTVVGYYTSPVVANARLFSYFDRFCTVDRPSVICGHTAFDATRWIDAIVGGESPAYPRLVRADIVQYKAFRETWEPMAKEIQVVAAFLFDAAVSHLLGMAAAEVGEGPIDDVVAELVKTIQPDARNAQLAAIGGWLAEHADVVSLTEVNYATLGALRACVADTHAVVLPDVDVEANDAQLTVLLIRKGIKYVVVSGEVLDRLNARADELGSDRANVRSTVAVRLTEHVVDSGEVRDRLVVAHHATSDGSTMRALLLTVEDEHALLLGDANCVNAATKGKLQRSEMGLMAAELGYASTFNDLPTMNRVRTAVGAQPGKASKTPERETKDGILVRGGDAVFGAVWRVNKLDGTCTDAELRPSGEWPSDHFAVMASVSK